MRKEKIKKNAQANKIVVQKIAAVIIGRKIMQTKYQ